MKETFFFSHDYNARTDPKIKDLLAEHGILGYGIFWALIEDLYSNSNVLRPNYKTIAYDLRCDIDVVKSVINDFALFEVNDEFFSSKSVAERLNKRHEKSAKASESVKKRWEKYDRDTNVLHSKNDTNNNKVKESKVKENNINILFQVFWDLYGNKKDRDKSEAKWNKLTDDERSQAIEDIPKYLASLEDRKFQKNPLTYLNGKCWKDERGIIPLPSKVDSPLSKRKYLNDLT